MEDVTKMLKLYKKLQSEFPTLSHKYPALDYFQEDITVHLTDHTIVTFSKKCTDYTRHYDIVRNFYLLKDFLTFHGFEQNIVRSDRICFSEGNMYIIISIYEIMLNIYMYEVCDDIRKNFDKIYDLIDYLKDYFNIQNKVVINE